MSKSRQRKGTKNKKAHNLLLMKHAKHRAIIAEEKKREEFLAQLEEFSKTYQKEENNENIKEVIPEDIQEDSQLDSKTE